MLTTERFSSRVDNYLKYRPHYPAELIPWLEMSLGLESSHAIADIGSGTGFSSELFLEYGNAVFGVEPNQEMRVAGESYLRDFPGFSSLDGTAEKTRLPPHSIDMVIAGQAFHWFDRARARQEFQRILKPAGWVVLLWNDRQLDTTPFLQAYEALLHEFGTDYEVVNHQNIDEAQIRQFFGHPNILKASFPNTQRLDFEALKGRLLSSSYTPAETAANYHPMLEKLRVIFDDHQITGHVEILYNTIVYAGRI